MKFRTSIGVGLILSSFAFFAGGTLILRDATDVKLRSERQIVATEKQCINLLKTLPNANVVMANDDVTVIIGKIVDPRKALTDATVASLMCPNKTLSDICLGDKCGPGEKAEVALRLKFTKGK
jgi:hypothetical protein